MLSSSDDVIQNYCDLLNRGACNSCIVGQVWIRSELNITAVERLISQAMPVNRPLPVDNVTEKSAKRTFQRVFSDSTQSSKAYFVVTCTGKDLSKAFASIISSNEMLHIGSNRSACNGCREGRMETLSFDNLKGTSTVKVPPSPPHRPTTAGPIEYR